MKGDNRQLIELFQFGRQRVAFSAGLAQDFPDFDEFVRAVGDGHDQAFDLGDGFAVTFFQAFAGLRQFLCPSGMFQVIFADIDFDQVRIQHVFLKARQDARFHLRGRNRPVVTARRHPAFAVTGTAPAFGSDDRPGAATDATARDPGQHVLRPAGLFRTACLDHPQDRLGGFPVLIADDPQFGHVFDQPFTFRVRPDQRLARARIDQLAGAVEDQLPDIELVLQNAVPALAITVKGGSAPEAVPARSRLGGGHTFRVQPFGDRARADPGGVFAEDPADDFGLVFVDFAKAADQLAPIVQTVRLAIAIGDPGGGALLRDSPALPALHLGGQILPELGVHKAPEGRSDFGHFPIGQGEQARARKGQPFADREGVALVTRDPVCRFGQNLFDAAARVIGRFDARQQSIQARPGPFVNPGRAADREIGEDVDNFPAFAIAAFAAQGDLVFDRPGVLQCRAEAGVDHCPHGFRRSDQREEAARFPSGCSWRLPSIC